MFHERTNCKVKFSARTSIEGPEGEYLYASTLHLVPKVDDVAAVKSTPRQP